MIESFFISKINSCLNFLQNKAEFLTKESRLLSGIDSIIFFFIFATIVATCFASSSVIGLLSTVVIVLTVFKLLFLKGQKIELKIFDGALLVYLVFCIISTINSSLVPQSVAGLNKTLIYTGFYFSFVQYLRYNKSKIKLFVLLIAFLCSFESIIGILQQKAGVLAGASWQDITSLNPEEIMTRVYGTIKPLNPNLFGAYVLSGVWTLIYLSLSSLYKKHYKLSLIFAIFVCVAGTAIFLSGCRGSYIGFAGLCFALILFAWKILNSEFHISDKMKKIWWTVIGFLICFTGFIIVMTPALLKRVISIFTVREDSSSSFRLNVYHAGLSMFRDNFLLGIGCGNKVFREIYGLYMLSGFDALSAYCIFLEIGIESGIFALLSFVVFIIIIFIDGIKLINAKIDIETKILAVCLLISFVGTMIHGLVDTVFFRPPVQILFWSVTAVFSVGCNVKKIKDYN